MLERLLLRLGSKYILWMMIATRAFGAVGGTLVVYYVVYILELSPHVRYHFNVSALAVVIFSLVATVLQGLWETRALRQVLYLLSLGRPVSPHLGPKAGREAMVVPVHHCVRAGLLVHLYTIPPVCLYMAWVADAPRIMLVHIAAGTCIAIILSMTLACFVMERMIQPVARLLTANGITIEFDNIPRVKLQNRMLFCFTLAILLTALIIAILTNQRAAEIIKFPQDQERLLQNMRTHTIIISCCAVVIAMALATVLAGSIGTRVSRLVRAMQRVERGDLEEQIEALYNDEIGTLGRSFNRMVRQLKQNQDTIGELNADLERKVQERTRQLSESAQELQRSYQQLKEHDRVKTAFFSNVSHELRTPLTLILAPVEGLLEEEDRLEPQQRGALEIVRRNTLKLVELINDLLDFAKLEAGKSTLRPGDHDINDLLREAVSFARTLGQRRGIWLKLALDSSVPRMQLDRQKIEKVITNLVSNALKFTEAGGHIELRSELRADFVEISVADTGIGIASEDQAKVFQRFVQIDGSLSRQFAGTGLGLALAKEFVELHQGEIGVESRIGQGSRFYFTIPLGLAADVEHVEENREPVRRTQLSDVTFPEPVPHETESRQPPADAATLLLVDDSPEVLAVVQGLLGADYRIITARDGQEGWERLSEELPDLVISDVMMPGIDGYELCRRAKSDSRTARIPLVLLTAKADLGMKIEGLSQGADDYLVKPFNAHELRARVRSLLRVPALYGEVEERNRELENLLTELKAAQDKLVHSEKLTSLGQLVAGIAHEINNSVNAIYNGIKPLNAMVKELSEEVQASVAPDANQGQSGEALRVDGAKVGQSFTTVLQLADVVENGAKRVAGIVADLKKFSHPGHETLVPYDIREVIEVPLNLLSNKLTGHIVIHKDYADVGKIPCSPGQLSQVFMNILDNAQQAIPDKGEIFLRIRQVDDHVVVSIRDTGPGIPPEVRSKIFDPFFTTKEVGVGTGLGLSISYGIVKRHGGTIEVTSEPNKGTEFTVRLPVGGSEQPTDGSVASGNLKSCEAGVG